MSKSGDKKKRTIDDYEFLVNDSSKSPAELGKGAYGTVKRAVDKNDGKTYAIKLIEKRALFRHSSTNVLMREIMIQKKIKHPHVIRLHHCFEDQKYVYLVLEIAENGSLFNYLRRRGKLEENEAFVYFFQTCLGIDYLHKINVVHRDLKPENLLLDRDGNIKLCDFGWSASNTNDRTTFCGTIDYMPPEMIKGEAHDEKLDIWCMGVLLYELLHGQTPFGGFTDKEKCSNIIRQANIKYSHKISSEGVDLINRILKPDPKERATMLEIFNHPWMKKYEKMYSIDISSYLIPADIALPNAKGPKEVKSDTKQHDSDSKSSKSSSKETKASEGSIPEDIGGLVSISSLPSRTEKNINLNDARHRNRLGSLDINELKVNSKIQKPILESDDDENEEWKTITISTPNILKQLRSQNPAITKHLHVGYDNGRVPSGSQNNQIGAQDKVPAVKNKNQELVSRKVRDEINRFMIQERAVQPPTYSSMGDTTPFWKKMLSSIGCYTRDESKSYLEAL